MLTSWFDDQLQHLQDRRSEWVLLYADQADFWDEVGGMMLKFVYRRYGARCSRILMRSNSTIKNATWRRLLPRPE